MCKIRLRLACADAGHNWIDPPKRERKRHVNYAENEYYRNALKAGGQRGPAGPRGPKMPQLQDFQFFNTARITALFEKAHAYETHQHELQRKRDAAEKQVRLDAPQPSGMCRCLSWQ